MCRKAHEGMKHVSETHAELEKDLDEKTSKDIEKSSCGIWGRTFAS